MTANRNFLHKILRRGLPLLALALAFAIPAAAQISAAWTSGCTGVSTNTVGNVTWTPAACQEFNGTTVAPSDTDPWTTWSFDIGNSGFGNNELETYCGPPGYPSNPAGCPTTFDPATANSYIDGKGHLVIQIVDNSGTWTSARMTTQATQAFQYGRIEASAKLPDLSSPGLWPAFWWLGTNITSVSWPACGESDIMEAWANGAGCGSNAGNVVNHSTIHYGVGGNPSSNGGTFAFPTGQQMNTAYYAYGVIWSANMLQYYVSQPTTTGTSTIQPFFIVTASDIQPGTTWPYNATSSTTGPAFLLLNVAVGGSCGGTTPAAPGPYQMLVDYVRQYGPSAVPAPQLGTPPAIAVAAGATTGNTSTFTPTLAPGTGYVYFSCDTAAPATTCSVQTNDPLNPHVINSDANPPESVTVTVNTAGAAAAAPPAPNVPVFPRPLVLILIAAIAVLALGFAWRWQRKRNWRHAPAFALSGCLLLLAAVVVSCGGGGSSPTPPGPPLAPTASLSASSSSIFQGGTVTLTASTTNATTCTASASPADSAWTGSVACNGSVTITPSVTGNVTYSISATGSGGSTTADTTVTVNPSTPAGNYSVNVYAFTESNTSNGANSNADANVAIPLTVN